MTSAFLASLAVVAAALATGCGTARRNPGPPLPPLLLMPQDMPQEVEPSKPLYLMSVVLRNDYNTEFQPSLVSVILLPDNGSQMDLRAFGMDSKGTVWLASKGGETRYLVRFVAEGSPHTLQGLGSNGGGAPFYAPLLLRIPVSAGGVHYLGSVKATVRKANDGEFLAAGFTAGDSDGASVGKRVLVGLGGLAIGAVGSVLTLNPAPLLAVAAGTLTVPVGRALGVEAAKARPREPPREDAAIYAQAGSTTGTFDIEITDDYDSDLEFFKETFAWLSDVEVKKTLLPQWDRAKVQNCWKQDTNWLSFRSCRGSAPP